MTLCQVCSNVEKKYKCPKCSILYCSVTCFKVHECQKPSENIVIIDRNQHLEIDAHSYLIETPEEYLLPKEKLESLKYSSEVKKLLENPHLRQFLQHAHETYNPGGFLKLAMQEPLFIEFADACLKTIHPEEYQKEFSDQEIIEHIKEAIVEQHDQ